MPNNLRVVDNPTENSIIDDIENAADTGDFVIIDLEGKADVMVRHCIGMADLVIIPAQGSALDAEAAAKTIALIRNQTRMTKREIPHAVLLTRTSPAIRTIAQKQVEQQLAANDVPTFKTSIVERTLLRDMFGRGAVLHKLTQGNADSRDKALGNAKAFTDEVLEKLSAKVVPIKPAKEA